MDTTALLFGSKFSSTIFSCVVKVSFKYTQGTPSHYPNSPITMSNSIADAFKKLNVSPDSTPSEHLKIFRVSYEYLSKVKNFNDLKAFTNCLVALINIDKYQRAYDDVIRRVPQSLIGSSILEVGYVYYKLGRAEELIKLYEGRTPGSEGIEIGLKHILAQTYYKVGSYDKALQIYHDLIENNKYDNQLDLIINERAIISQLNFRSQGQHKSKYPIDPNTDNYDLLFNEALIELSNNNIPTSLNLLESAQRLCKANTDWTPEDLLAELLPINITMAYVYDLLGDSTKSMEILNENDLDSINDTMLKLIVKNNIYAKTENKAIGLVERDLQYQQNLHKLNQKLTKWQYQVILKNNILLKFSTGTLSKSQLNNKFIQNYLNDFPGDLFPLAFKLFIQLDISFTDLHDSTKLKSVGRKLIKFIKNDKVSDEHLKQVALLLLVYVNLQIGSFDQALIILEEATAESISRDKLVPGIVGSLINLYEKTHASKKLTELLIKLAEKFLTTPQDIFKNDGDYYNTAKIIAFKALNQGHADLSSKLFNYLHSVNQEDHLISSILSNSNIDLFPISELVSSKPIDKILSVDIDTLIPSTIKSSKPISRPTSKVAKKKKKPKFGPSKVIKPQDELNLDEERWLPMKLRSYYKPTKKDKKKNTGQQGAAEPHAAQAPSHSTSSNKKKKKKGKK